MTATDPIPTPGPRSDAPRHESRGSEDPGLRGIMDRLTALPHRGSATRLEAEARHRMAELLHAAGHSVTRHAFTSPRTYGWELLVISLLLAVGGLVPSGWIALVGLAGLVTYFSGWPIPWRRLVDRFPSENLLAQAGEGPRTLVLMAHLDTAKSFFPYHPKQVKGFRRSFLTSTTLAVLTVPAAFLLPLGARVVGAYFLLYALALLHRELTAPYVNGANDNASGVAVATRAFLDLARRPPRGWRVMLALTGCEEVGAKGATALVRDDILPRDALILNVDNVGRGALHYAEGEGMLGYFPFRGELLAAARSAAEATPLAYRLAYFDTLPFTRAGFACLTLIRLEDGVPPNWHWPSDTIEGVDLDAVEDTYRYAMGLAASVVAGSDSARRMPA
jgi:hypothetical protein